MDSLEKIKVNREKTDSNNTAIMKVLSKTLDTVYREVGCYGDCENCVLGSKKNDECLASDIGKLNKKIKSYIDIDDSEVQE